MTRSFLVIVNGDYLNTLTIGVSVQLSEDLALSSSSTMIPNCMPPFGNSLDSGKNSHLSLLPVHCHLLMEYSIDVIKWRMELF